MELLDEKRSSDFKELSTVPEDPKDGQSNKRSTLRVKLEVESLMIRKQGGILACTVTEKLTMFDLVIGRSELM